MNETRKPLTVEILERYRHQNYNDVRTDRVCDAARAWVEEEERFWEAAKTAPLPGEQESESIHSRAAEEYEQLIKTGTVERDLTDVIDRLRFICGPLMEESAEALEKCRDALAQCRDTCALLEEENAIPSVREYNDLRDRVAELEKIHDGRKEVGRAVAGERERCARIVQDWRQEPNEDREVLLPEIAAAIRAP